MKSISVLIKHLEYLINKSTELNDDGIEYFEDLTIPACELNDLSSMINAAKEEVNNKKEQRTWELAKEMMLKNNAYEPDSVRIVKNMAETMVKAWYEE